MFEQIQSLPHDLTDALILTAAPEQADFLQQDYASQRLASGLKHWRTLEIYSLSTWLRLSWQQLSEQCIGQFPFLLTDMQANLLWRQILSQNDAGIVYQIESLANLAKEAWNLLRTYSADIHRYPLPDNATRWLIWRDQYVQLCQDKRCCDLVGWVSIYHQFLNSTSAIFPSVNRIILYGFTDLLPLYQQLFIALMSHIKVDVFQPQSQMHTCGQVEFSEVNEEIHAMIAWVKQRMKPNQRIACVAPNLRQVWPKIRQSLRDRFPQELPLFSLSQTKSLTSIPMINHGLVVLNCLKKNIASMDYQTLLRSSFMGGYEREMVGRAHLITRIKALQAERFTLTTLKTYSASCPDWFNRVSKLPQVFYDKRTPSAWAAEFNESLTTMGWPGEGTLTLLEQAAFEAWQEVLLELAAQQFLYEELTLSCALGLLKNLVIAWRFVPDKMVHAPLHFLPLNALPGLSFDAVWIMGLQEDTLPPPPRVQPFLPLPLQKDFHFPQATADEAYKTGVKLFSMIQSTAPEIVMSTSTARNGESVFKSPLLTDLPTLTLSLDTFLSVNEQIFKARDAESWVEDRGAPVMMQESLRGGYAIFKDQALCPFRAYAKHRLNAVNEEEAQFGFSPKEKGILLHQALESIWACIPSHAQLETLSESDLQGLIEAGIAKALTSGGNFRSTVMLDLERMRMRTLLKRWFALEKKRDPFEVIAREHVIEGEFAGLPLSLRVDRIDKVGELSFYILDYKTGYHSPNVWFDERPEEPQLPLYGLMSDLPVSGLIVAQLSADKLGFKGVVAHSAGVPGAQPLAKYTPSDWATQLETWRKDLTELALAFKMGVAQVNPKSPQVCTRCDLQLLCRASPG